MSRKPPRSKIGIIGLGIIGSRVAATLRGAGFQVYVWSRSPHPQPNFVGSAVEVADLCDFIQIFVSDDAALLETVRTLAAALSSRHLIAGHPTVAPETAREAAKIVQATGARYLDAPFTGSKTSSASAQLVYYLAGPELTQREARPVLEASSKKIVSIGEEFGQAAVVKLATNMMAALHVQGLAEALAVARAGGVDPARFAEAVEFNGARSGTSDNKLPLMLAGKYEPHFPLKHLLKDVRHALRLAAAHRLSTPATGITGALIAGAVARGWGELDFCALAKNYESAASAASASQRANGGRAPGATTTTTTNGAASAAASPALPQARAASTEFVKPTSGPVEEPVRAATPEADGAVQTPTDKSPQDSTVEPEPVLASGPAAEPAAAESAAAENAVAEPPRKTRSLLRSILGLGQKETPPTDRSPWS